MLLYVGWLILYWSLPQRPLYPWWFEQATVDFSIILGGVSLLASIPLDYVSITASLKSISGEIASGTWDLLRLTAVREGELVLAKHATTQLRAWRATMWVIGLRIITSLIAAIGFFARYLDATNPSVRNSLGFGLLFVVFSLVPFVVLFGIFALEPLWRMRAVTALGMVISARVRDGASAALLAVATVLALWIVQALVLVAVVAGLGVLLFVLFNVLGLCAPTILPLIVFPTVYGFYSILKTWSLRQVARRLFALTG